MENTVHRVRIFQNTRLPTIESQENISFQLSTLYYRTEVLMSLYTLIDIDHLDKVYLVGVYESKKLVYVTKKFQYIR